MNTPDQVFLRDYSKIYTGSNQIGGYDNPFLGFVTDTVAITFRTDKSSYFHYPNTAEQMYLSATDLIECGAFAGSIPYKADKIFKKQADYKNDIPNGNAYPENLQKGVWLCAWLSGNDSKPTQMPVWTDRWYKPGYLDSTQSLFVCSTSAVYDEPSKLTFDPGVWYRYDHIGNTSNSQIVSLLCGLKVEIDDWAEVSIDTSGNGNNGSLQNYTASMISDGVNSTENPSDKGLKLNGINQYASILYDPTFDVSNDLTCNVWIKSDDWQNQVSHHFISNGLRGGWSIGINNGFFTPLNVLLDDRGNLIFNNQANNFYKDIVLPGSPAPVSYAIDSELYTWILDNGTYNGSKHLYKMDYNSNIDNAVSFTSAITLTDVVIDKNNLVWVTDGSTISAFNDFCKLVDTTAINGNRLVVNGLNSLTAFNAIDACVFENTYYWTIDSLGDLYCNGDLISSGLSASNVQCTMDNIWVLFDEDKIVQFNKEIIQLTNTVTFTKGISTTIPDTISSDVSGRNLYFTYENIDTTYIWVLQPNTGYLYKYDTSLNLIQKTNTSYVKNSMQGNAVRGDASGYRWHHLFNYTSLKVPGMSQVEAMAYMGTGSPLLSGQKYKTIIPVSALSVNDWHMFSFSMNSNGLSLYMDTILRNTISIPASSSIYYKYETPLFIGTNAGHIIPLDEELNKIDQLYHLGGFDDLKIYTNTLSNSDIHHIYLTKFNFRDLIWDMPTGTQSYVEEILRFFKFKMPGQKSQYYNIHLKGLQIQDENTRQIIEDIIKDTIKKIAPLYTSLYKIIWD